MRPASEEFFRICRSPLKQTRALLASNPPGINGGSNPIPWARDPSVGLLRGHRWVPAALPWASGLPWASCGGHRWSRLGLLSPAHGWASRMHPKTPGGVGGQSPPLRRINASTGAGARRRI